jgi:ATP-binding protein involved in chromosome partitioning
VIVSTPQEVALLDASKGASMFHKVEIPVSILTLFSSCNLSQPSFQIRGFILNQAYYTCPSCSDEHKLYGSPSKYHDVVQSAKSRSLCELPLLTAVSEGSDSGVPEVVRSPGSPYSRRLYDAADSLWKELHS